MKGKLKQVKGITLIALVITIIVLLILAGVSIAMLTGNNGILTQATNAKVEQSHGAVREGIALAYNEYQIEINTASNTKLASTEIVQIQGKEEKALASYSSFLDFLSQKGYADSSTGIIDVEALTGGKQALGNGKDTDVYKIEKQDGSYVVNYYDEKGISEEIWSIANSDNVEINITKTNIPNDENAGAVLLTVDKVIQNGTELTETMQLTEEEYYNMLLQKLQTMTDEEKGTMILELFNILGTPFKDINEVIEYVYNQGFIGANTEDAFYEYVEANLTEFANTIYQSNYNLIGEYDKETGELQRYTVKNPEGESSNTYIATQNGDYAFTVEIEGKEYSKIVNVNNIKESGKDYKIEQDSDYIIRLKDVENNNYTTFSEAYLLNNGELINVTNKIGDEDEDGIADINAYNLSGTIGLEYRDGEVTRTIILNKDGNCYISEIKIHAKG